MDIFHGISDEDSFVSGMVIFSSFVYYVHFASKPFVSAFQKCLLPFYSVLLPHKR